MSNTVIETDETMVVLPEQEVWVDDIHGKGLNTLAMGGVDGQANTASRQLTNRTSYLNKMFIQLEQWKNGLDFSAFADENHTHDFTHNHDNEYASKSHTHDPIVGVWQELTLQGSFTGYFKIRETIVDTNVRLIEIETMLRHPSTTSGAEAHIANIPLAFQPQYDTSLIFYKMGGLFPYAYNGFILVDYEGSIAEVDKGYVGIKFHGGNGATSYKTGASYFIVGGAA